VFLGGYRLLLARQAPGGMLTELLVYAALLSLPVGAQGAGLLLWGYRAWTRAAGFPKEPGHWLLAVEGSTAFAALVGQLAGAALIAEFQGEIEVVPFLLALMMIGPALGIGGYATALQRSAADSRWWQNALIFLLAQRALGGLFLLAILPAILLNPRDAPPIWLLSNGSFTGSCCYLGPINAVYIALAAAFDPARRERDFLHWSGVGAIVAVGLGELLLLMVSSVVR
jgi:hypothetical protein